jgi:hypothetical protein
VNTATRARETANTVTKDFLTFSQPFIHEGALLSSSTSGRRLFIHHLSEVPLGTDVFTTQIGNQLKRTDKNTVAMGDIKLDIKPFPEGIANVPTPKIISQVPTAAFTGPAEARDKLAVQLINKGKEANSAGEFAAACACFESAYALARREGMLVSAANMRLKLGDAYTAAAMYRQLLSDPGLLDAKERDMATRKLKEAQDVLKTQGGGDPAARGTGGSSGGKGGSSGGGKGGDFADFEADFVVGGGDDDEGSDDGFADFDDAPPPPKSSRAAPPAAPKTAPPLAFGNGGSNSLTLTCAGASPKRRPSKARFFRSGVH